MHISPRIIFIIVLFRSVFGKQTRVKYIPRKSPRIFDEKINHAVNAGLITA
jgi:hypothetical protein